MGSHFLLQRTKNSVGGIHTWQVARKRHFGCEECLHVGLRRVYAIPFLLAMTVILESVDSTGIEGYHR